MPVTSEISDDNTGSFGRVNVVLPRPSRLHRSAPLVLPWGASVLLVRLYRPDRTLLELGAGVKPSDAYVGDYLLSPGVDA